MARLAATSSRHASHRVGEGGPGSGRFIDAAQCVQTASISWLFSPETAMTERPELAAIVPSCVRAHRLRPSRWGPRHHLPRDRGRVRRRRARRRTSARRGRAVRRRPVRLERNTLLGRLLRGQVRRGREDTSGLRRPRSCARFSELRCGACPPADELPGPSRRLARCSRSRSAAFVSDLSQAATSVAEHGRCEIEAAPSLRRSSRLQTIRRARRLSKADGRACRLPPTLPL